MKYELRKHCIHGYLLLFDQPICIDDNPYIGSCVWPFYPAVIQPRNHSDNDTVQWPNVVWQKKTLRAQLKKFYVPTLPPITLSCVDSEIQVQCIKLTNNP